MEENNREEKDELFDDAARIVVRYQDASTSLIQRRLKLGYNRAGRLMDALTEANIVTPGIGPFDRKVLFKTEKEVCDFLKVEYQKSAQPVDDIHTEHHTTKVKFGNEQKANIAVRASHGKLTLQMLATEKQIDDKITPSDIQNLPRVELMFSDTKSIDVMIAALQVIKKNATTPPRHNFDQLAMAC